MKAVDSSVAIAAFAVWHVSHDVARGALAEGPSIVLHAMVETYSVLTRLPGPQRASATHVAEFLHANFSSSPLSMSARDSRQIPRRLAALEVVGGATYDALIALTAAAHGATLVTLDRRAISVYQRCGAAFDLLAE